MRLAPAPAVALAAGLLVSLLAEGEAHAGDPRLRWRTLSTDHFRIHYYQGEEQAARGMAVRAERAHRIIAPLLAHVPSQPTHVVLTDSIDSANGSATVLPYNALYLFLSGPESESVLNDFDDWANVLITHEYSHILHLDNVSGLPRLVNAVLGLGLGKVYAPNQIEPRWFIEGLATYEESRHTTAGRTRSRLFDMYLRMAVLEGHFQSIDKVSSGQEEFPHGTTAYLYGALFLKYIADRFGEEVLARVSELYGGRTIPFGLNRAIADATGYNYETLWSDFRTALEHRYEVERAAIETRGRTIETRLTYHEEATALPQPWPSADGRRRPEILYLRQDGYSRPALMLVPATGGLPRLLYKMIGGGKGVPLPDGKTIITSEGDVCRTYYYYNDLFAVDVATGRRRRLTECARALDPDVSPDGRWIAFSANEEGGRGSSLAIVPTSGDGPIRYLVRPGGSATRVYTPAWSPDGASIAYSEMSDGGFRDIVVYELSSGRSRRIQHDRAFDVTPHYSPDGRFLLFSSDRTGVYNVFAYELGTEKLWQVTNVLGGAFQPIVAPGGRTLVYQGFTSLGYDLFAASYDPASFKEALPYLSDREDAPLGELAAPPESVIRKDAPYSPWSTVHPWRIASLKLAPGSFADLLTLDLTGADVTNIHSWMLHLEQALGERGETNFALSYTWDRLWSPLSASVGHRTVRSGGLVVDTVARPYAEEQWNAQAAALLPVVRRIDHSVTINLGYHYNHFGAADALAIPLDPNQSIPEIPEQGAIAGLSAGFAFSNVRRYLYSVTGEEGRTLSLNLNLNHEALGGDFRTVDVSWSWTEFLRMPFRRHVLELSYGGGIGQGNLRRRGLFFLGGFGDNAPGSTLLLCALKVRSDNCPAGTPVLRGYIPGAFVGDQFHVFSSEYRFPIAEIEHGHSTLPIYLTRLVGAVYADYGLAYFGRTDFDNWKLGIGGELGLNLTLGYGEASSLRVGYAKGLMKGGQDQIYLQFQLGALY